MKIRSLDLTGWRNYSHQFVSFDNSPTVFLGANGQGKTNLVEALVYVSQGHSHRSHRDSVLVKNGETSAIIRLIAEDRGRTVTVDCEVTAAGSNTVRVNGAPMKMKDLPRILPLVLFAPEDMDLVRGEPEYRRRFLDDLLLGGGPRMSAILSDYERILKQRNSLLKTLKNNSAGDTRVLDTWTASLVDVGTVIMMERRRVVTELAPRVAHHYSSITTTEQKVDLSLSESIPIETGDKEISDALTEMFHVKHREERDKGTTLCGPHRDDLVITLNGLPARTHSSQGEAWSTALSLRLAQVDYVKERSIAGDPVVILDDVFSELDASRRTRLGEHLSTVEHVIITAADGESIPVSLRGTIFSVSEGTVNG